MIREPTADESGDPSENRETPYVGPLGTCEAAVRWATEQRSKGREVHSVRPLKEP